MEMMLAALIVQCPERPGVPIKSDKKRTNFPLQILNFIVFTSWSEQLRLEKKNNLLEKLQLKSEPKNKLKS